MKLLRICGYVVILFTLAGHSSGATVTQETQPTSTPVHVSASSVVSWYVVPPIVWSSVAAFFLLVVTVLAFCFVYKRRTITETGHQRFYNVYEREKESSRQKHRYLKKERRSNRGNSERLQRDDVREYETLGGMRVQTIDLDNVMVPPPGWENDIRRHSQRSDIESELFNINKVNPVYDYSTDDQSRQMDRQAKLIDKADLYEPGDIVVKLHDSARDLSRVPSVRGLAAASFSGLPAPSMTQTGSHVIHVKYEKTSHREEPAIYRDSSSPDRDSYIADTYHATQVEPHIFTRENESRSSYKVESTNPFAPAPFRSTSGEFIVSEETDIEHNDKKEAHDHIQDVQTDLHTEQNYGSPAPMPSDYISPVMEQSPTPIKGTYKTYITPAPGPATTVAPIRMLSSHSSGRATEKTESKNAGSRRFWILRSLEDLMKYHPTQKKQQAL